MELLRIHLIHLCLLYVARGHLGRRNPADLDAHPENRRKDEVYRLAVRIYLNQRRCSPAFSIPMRLASAFRSRAAQLFLSYGQPSSLSCLAVRRSPDVRRGRREARRSAARREIPPVFSLYYQEEQAIDVWELLVGTGVCADSRDRLGARRTSGRVVAGVTAPALSSLRAPCVCAGACGSGGPPRHAPVLAAPMAFRSCGGASFRGTRPRAAFFSSGPGGPGRRCCRERGLARGLCSIDGRRPQQAARNTALSNTSVIACEGRNHRRGALPGAPPATYCRAWLC
jgi:hypothetical protein